MNLKIALFIRFFTILVLYSAIILFSKSTTAEESLESPEALISELYDLVTIEANSPPDWERVKSMFLENAIIVLRTSRDSSTVFTVDGFVQDFMKFIENSNVQKTGFVEKIIKMKPTVFGDIAHVLVLYEASIPGSQRPPQQGVDSFQLIKKNDRWWIVSITNEIPTPNRPIPLELQN